TGRASMTVTSRSGASVLRMRATVPPPAPPPTMTTLAPPLARAGLTMSAGPAAPSAAPPRRRANSLRSIMISALLPARRYRYRTMGRERPATYPLLRSISVQREDSRKILDRRTFLLRGSVAAGLLAVLLRVPAVHAEASAAQSAEFKAALE